MSDAMSFLDAVSTLVSIALIATAVCLYPLYLAVRSIRKNWMR